MAAAKQKQRLLAALAIALLALLLGPAAGQLLPCLFASWLPVLGKYYSCPTTSPLPGPSQGGQPTGKGLSEGYYSQSCPKAEELVWDAVYEGTKNNRGLNAGLIRLHFHDCFVRGCDASVLLDKDEDGNTQTEKTGPPNANSLRGFEVINAAKEKVEEACRGKVSCADILAIAARDASKILSYGKIDYKVYLGRLDGRKSKDSETNQLPGPGSNIQQLKLSFAFQGLNPKDLVALSGAHTVGQARCMFATRQNEMDSDCVSKVKGSCDGHDQSNTMVALDNRTPGAMDNQYFKNIPGCVLFPSDKALMDSSDTSAKVDEYAADNGNKWWYDFGEAMRKMGNITTNPPSGVEIRKVCSQVN